MELKEFTPRKFKFKAWNKEERLLMKLSSIECVKGELSKKGHTLLQFTGMLDKHDEEIYEMDILLRSDHKFLVRWHDENNGWNILPFPALNTFQPLISEMTKDMKRLCNYFESEQA